MFKCRRLVPFFLLLAAVLFITAFPGCASPQPISAAETRSIIDRAVSYQTEGGIYHADSYRVEKLAKGSIIYGMLPGQSVFYFDAATVEEGEGSYKKLYGLLQIRPHPVYGYRTNLGKYEVLEDMHAACGVCRANGSITVDGKMEYLGDGGGFQYVIFEYEEKLKLLEESDLDE